MGVLVRPAPVYVEGVKIAEVASGSYEHMSNDEDTFGVEGWLGMTDGADQVRMSFKTVTPVAGHQKALKDVIVNKRYVQILIPLDGGTEAFEGRMTSRSYDWDSKSGACNGNFSFQGGKPTVV